MGSECNDCRSLASQLMAYAEHCKSLRNELAAQKERVEKAEFQRDAWKLTYDEWVGDDCPTREQVERMKAELAALREEREWRPISTAPRDGTPVLAWVPEADLNEKYPKTIYHLRWIPANGIRDSHGWRWNGWSFKQHPTHWMPLPEGPGVDGLEKTNGC